MKFNSLIKTTYLSAMLAMTASQNPAIASDDDDDIIPILLTVLLGGKSAPIYRCEASLLQDLNGSTSSSSYKINPQFLELNGLTLFLADHPTFGAEVWITDGTTAGTTLLKDINQGSADGIFGAGALSTRFMERVGNQVFFVADNGVSGEELWVTNGTTNGTRMVKDITGTSFDADISNLTAFNGKLYFIVDSGAIGVNDEGLWMSDGTASGTVLVKDVHSSNTSAGTDDDTMVVLGNQLIFRGDSSPGRYELWSSDGTTAGTSLLKDINPGSGPSFPEEFVTINDRVFFHANDGTHGTELWTTDGTSAGTRLVKDIRPGASGSMGDSSINIKYSFYRNPGYNNKLYFVADDGTTGRELWTSDGTTLGTQRVADINTGSNSAFRSSFPLESMAVFNDRLYFQAERDDIGYELWSLDQNDSVSLYGDLFSGFVSSQPQFLSASPDFLYFVSNQHTRGDGPTILDASGRNRVITILDNGSEMNTDYLHVRDNGAVLFTGSNSYSDIGAGLYQILCPSE
ncbi:hypothetical protein OAS86_06540 [Gammaproteobacteria bacterium]|nr:hypothetical protein [Gammaproteobacteria bacterium]